jgi:transcriptional regulator with XRE-family HTH domain
MLTRKQVKMARAALNWSVRDLAAQAGVTANTISRYENGSDALTETLLKIRRAFEQHGVIFIPENGGGAGVRLRDRESDEKKPGEPVSPA